VKFQWSKVAAVLGSYSDFIKAYGMSISAAGFSNDQIAAQLDTISRKYEQLKATITGIATGMGASGLSAYIKNILSSLNAFAQSLQRIPTYVWKILGGFVALAGAVGAALVVVKLLAAGIGAVTAGVTAYTAAAAAGTIATEGMAAAVTAATGGLNILLGLAVAAVAACFG
jgi:phage-related protein